MDRISSELYQAIRQIARQEALRLQVKTKMGTVEGSVKDGVANVVVDGNDSATACAALVGAYPKDRVLVSLDPSTGEPAVIGNKTNPSVNDSEYQHVKDVAKEANELLVIVSDAADKAETTVEQIFTNASQAGAAVEEIKNYVGMAEGYTETLTQRVEQAESSLGEVRQSAAGAAASAAAAAESAKGASEAAVRAEGGLARVEDVVGTVNWLAEHARPTGDAAAKPGKDYYVRDGATGALVLADVAEGDPVDGLYELTETVQNYIASYLALVDGTLKLSSGSTARVELSTKALRFYSENDVKVAEIAVTNDDVSYLNVRKMKVNSGLYFEQWRMFRRRNGNLALKWNNIFE